MSGLPPSATGLRTSWEVGKRKGRPKAASHSQAATPFLDDVSCSHLGSSSEYVFADYSMDTPIAVDH
jgi:hypothetical protein